MKLFDFFFPEQAQASHLRRIAEQQSYPQRRTRYQAHRSAAQEATIDKRLEALEDEVGFLTLMLESIIRKTEEKGVMTRAELQDIMQEVDAEDGNVDGKYTPRK